MKQDVRRPDVLGKLYYVTEIILNRYPETDTGVPCAGAGYARSADPPDLFILGFL